MDPREVANPTYKLLSRVFFDPDAARELLEAMRWPDGPVCPHCGAAGAYKLAAKPGSKRPVRTGVYKCKNCRKQFTVTVGTVFAESHVGLHRWMYGIHLMCSAKKGIRARQLERTLGVQYKTAWFMCHRIRKAMEADPGRPTLRDRRSG